MKGKGFQSFSEADGNFQLGNNNWTFLTNSQNQFGTKEKKKKREKLIKRIGKRLKADPIWPFCFASVSEYRMKSTRTGKINLSFWTLPRTASDSIPHTAITVVETNRGNWFHCRWLHWIESNLTFFFNSTAPMDPVLEKHGRNITAQHNGQFLCTRIVVAQCL